MAFRRLWAGVPLAVLVAALAHVAGFGFAHAPGGDHATDLFGVLGAALATLLGGAFMRAAIVAAPKPIATKHGRSKSTFVLAALAAGAFAAIELAEGHSVSAAGLLPWFALIPLAFVVSVAARRADRLARRAGVRAAIYLRRARARVIAAFVERVRARVRAYGIVARRVARGRAPPRFA